METKTRRPEVVPVSSRQLCAWCGCDLGPLPYPAVTPSYGICPACYASVVRELHRNAADDQEPEADDDPPAR
jgi:hypothetical protein